MHEHDIEHRTLVSLPPIEKGMLYNKQEYSGCLSTVPSSEQRKVNESQWEMKDLALIIK